MDSVLERGFEAAEAAAKVGHHRAEMNAQGAICFAALEMGELDILNRSAEQALALVKKLKAFAWEPLWPAHLAMVSYLHGAVNDAEELAERASRMSPSFTRSWQLGILSLVARDAKTKEWALKEGESLLKVGAIGSNHIHFYRYAIETCLQTSKWKSVDRYTQALETFTSAEPLPWGDFIIARGRALATVGKGDKRSSTKKELGRLLDLASSKDYKIMAVALEEALAAM